MSAHHKSRIIVMSDGHLVGVISLADLAAVDEPRAAHTLRAIATREVLSRTGRRTDRTS